MGRAKKTAKDVRDTVRFLATGRTTSRSDRQALADYQSYQAREQARERQERN